MDNKIILKTETETIDFAYKFGKFIHKQNIKPLIITLNGDLGAGKTTFTKGFVKSLNSKNQVTSPTFSLANEYYGDSNIYHLDLYRINANEFFEAGLDEYFKEEAYILIEWAENLPSELYPENKIDLFFNINKFREIKISSKFFENIVKEFEKSL